jgi:protein O-GlcNAc transferase
MKIGGPEMGLFDRLRSAATPPGGDACPDAFGQDATRLIEQGHALEAEGKLDEAMQCYLEAIRLAPNPARGHLNRGNILLLQGNLDDALDAFRTALKFQPDYAGAHYNIGNALIGNCQFDDAVASYRSALAINPDYAEAHCALGVALKELGQLDEAVASFQKALLINPGMVEARNNLGTILQHYYNTGMQCLNDGKPQEAATYFRNALAIEPNLAEAHCNLGAALQELGRNEDAAASYRRAIEIKPDFAEAHGSLGVVLHDLWKFDEEVASYRRAIEIKPDFALAHSNLGVTLKEQGKLAESEASYRRALEIEPDNALFRAVQTFTLPIAPQSISDSTDIPAQFDHALQELDAWLESSPANRARFSDAVGLQHPFYLAYRSGNHVGKLSRYGDLVASADQSSLPSQERSKIRLSVISNHLHRHSVWDVILRGILANLDRTRFEVFLYSMGRQEDEETQFARSHCDVWRDTHTVKDFDGWLEAIRTDRPDVIFYPEIGMNTMTLRLACRRLAPLQIASWGHPITTGLPTIDRFFSGELLEAPDADTHYREKLVRLPGTGCCTMPIAIKPETIPEIEMELAKRSGVRFVIAQTPFKFDPADDELFADIAAVVGASTFILLNDPQFSWATTQLVTRIKRAFRERSLDPDQHLLVIPWLPREKFYALLDLCDIYLDCPSFSGYTTAWQAVHRGLPLVTLEGEFLRQRLAAGLLRKIGMADTIVASRAEYVAIAARLADECRDPVRRAARRDALKAAAPQADHDTTVVRAFEQSVIDAFDKMGRNSGFVTYDMAEHHPIEQTASTFSSLTSSEPGANIITNDIKRADSIPDSKISTGMISIIVCSINDAKAQAIKKHYHDLFGNELHEIIIIRDARSLAEAYNRGIDRAVGDVFIFSHDDIEFLNASAWLPRLRNHLDKFDIVGLAGTTRMISSAWASAGPPYTFGQIAELDGQTAPYRVLICSAPAPAIPGIQGLDGLFFAVKRKVVEQIRFDEQNFDGFHCYDTDFTYQAYLAGFKLAVATDLFVLHASQGHFDKKWEFYSQRFLAKHRIHLNRIPQRTFQHTLVMAQNKNEILEIMSPPLL